MALHWTPPKGLVETVFLTYKPMIFIKLTNMTQTPNNFRHIYIYIYIYIYIIYIEDLMKFRVREK